MSASTTPASRRRIRTLPPTTTRACTSPSQGCCRAASPIPSCSPTHAHARTGPRSRASSERGQQWRRRGRRRLGRGLTSVNIGILFIVNPGNGDRFIEAIEQMVNFDVTNNSWNRIAPFYLPTDNILIQPRMSCARSTPTHSFPRPAATALALSSCRASATTTRGAGKRAQFDALHDLGCRRRADGFVADYSNYGACILVTAPTGPSLTVFTPAPALSPPI